MAAAAEAALVLLTLRALVGWPPNALQVAAVCTIPIPLALLFDAPRMTRDRVERLVVGRSR